MARRQKKCRDIVRAGKRLPWHPRSGKYEICITPTQWAKLFPEGRGQKLGCGAFACAWEQSPGAKSVVKITRDRDDVAGLLATQDHPRVAQVRAAYKLTGSGKSREEDTEGKAVPVYALVMERLRPFPLALKKLLDRVPVEKMAREYRTRRGSRAKFRVSEEVRHKLNAACYDMKEKAKCRALLHNIADTYEDLAREGVVWLDIHPQNFGTTADGTWKILDLGNSLVRVQRTPALTPLRGPQRRWRRRPKPLR